MIKRLGLIGHIADGQEKFDGQTVSTRIWRDELRKESNDLELIIVDTFEYKRRFIKLLKSWLKCMVSCSHIVVMLSGNGMRFFFPLLYYSNKIFKRKIFHRVIGGNLSNYVDVNPIWIKYLNAFEINWVQSPKMVEYLFQQGIYNAVFLENFRNVKSISNEELTSSNKKPFLFCTFCRVSKAKGITLAIETIANINSVNGEGTAEIHIYGPIEKEYKKEFLQLIEQNKESVKYMGSIESSKAVDTLKKYYFHIFPTTWDGEGFPGTLIDCYNAGLPTIASNWAYNSEYIKNGVTGFLYDWKHPEDLEKNIQFTLNYSEEHYFNMREANLKEAEKYSAEKIMQKIFIQLQQ